MTLVAGSFDCHRASESEASAPRESQLEPASDPDEFIAPGTDVPLSKIEADTWRARLGQWQGTRLDASYQPHGSLVSIRTLHSVDRPIVIAFWASYCPPCVEEIPMFDRLYDEGYAVAGISLDADNYVDVKEVLDRRKPHYPQLVLDEPSMRAAGQVLAHGLPFTLIVDENGAPQRAFDRKVERKDVLHALRSANAP